jgi:hypothetical protein
MVVFRYGGVESLAALQENATVGGDCVALPAGTGGGRRFGLGEALQCRPDRRRLNQHYHYAQGRAQGRCTEHITDTTCC